MNSGMVQQAAESLPTEGPSADPGAATRAIALTPDEIRRALADVPAWKCAGDRLIREFAFANFDRTIAFVNAVAWVAHAQDHHPDLFVSYDRCRVEYSTHDCDGLSQRDFNSARQLDRLYDRRA